MASSTSRQDESNPDLWLATWVSRQDGAALPAQDYPLWKKNFSKSHIVNSFFTKFVRSRWLDIGLVFFSFCKFKDHDSIAVHKNPKKNLAKIQPSWPQPWSITHTYKDDWGFYFKLLALKKTIRFNLTNSPLVFPRAVKCSPKIPLKSWRAFCISGWLSNMASAFMGSACTCDRAAVKVGSISSFAREGLLSIFFNRSSVIQSTVKM